MLEPVVIGQDDQTELHVQAVIQSGRRQLDIRIWRRGPTGFSPSRRALTLEAADVDALRDGIAELLEASSGGRQVARVVWDKDEGRRLRAETEPFGTRFVARLGFWQRVRDTWRQSDDGLVLGAEQLKPLKDVLDALRPRLLAPDDDGFGSSLTGDGHLGLQPASLQRWPTPGADWLTLDPDRLGFHPRGVRITASVEDTESGHRIALRQWRREDSLWVPEDATLFVGILDIEMLLLRLRELADGKQDTEQNGEDTDTDEADPVTVRATMNVEGSARTLLIEERLPAPDDYRFEPRLSMPAEYLPRLGRMFAQAGLLLLKRLSPDERAELQSRQGPEIVPAIVNEAIGTPDESEIFAEEGEIDATGEDGEETTEDGVLPLAHGATVAGEDRTVPAASRDDSEPTRRLTALGEVQLGRFLVFLYLQEDQQRQLALLWNGYALLLPLEQVQQMLDDLRDLYYDSIRGRRGKVLTAGTGSSIRISVLNQGSSTSLVLEQETEGKLSRLAFPVDDVPGFLNAVTAATKKVTSQDL